MNESMFALSGMQRGEVQTKVRKLCDDLRYVIWKKYLLEENVKICLKGRLNTF